MLRLACISALCAILFVPPNAAAQEEGRREKKEKRSWEQFEEEIDRFVRKMTGEFTGEDLEFEAPDTAASRIVILRADTVIAAGDTVRGNISFRGGNVLVLGTITGSLRVTDGELRLGKSARISGDVSVYGGGVEREDGAVVQGAIESRTSAPEQNLVYDIPSEKWPGLGWRTRIPWQSEHSSPDNLVFRFNRVEGIFLGLGSEKRLYWDGRREFGAYGSIGYGFSAHRWRGILGATRQFALDPERRSALVEIGLEGYSLTDSKDQWTLRLGENTAAALLMHEEFRDYFERSGVTTYAAYYRRTRDLFAEARLSYSADSYESLDMNADWAIFGGDKSFRDNPAIDHGTMRSIGILGALTTAERMRHGPIGWTTSLQTEFANRESFGGDFTFESVVADIRRFQPVGEHDNLNLRLRIGTSHGDLPRQRSFDLGGPGTLPAYRFKEFPADTLGANRMILFNVEYVVNGDFLGDLDFWPSWLMRYVSIIFIADAGWVRRVDADRSMFRGFEEIGWTDFKSDVGFAIGNRSGSFRIGWGWRTDRDEPARLVLRFARPF